MEGLKAFVGHSFDENDDVVIKRFLDYFDSLRDTVGLEWDHAKRAEAKELAIKVKQKMEDKNLFIGIFTAKDYKVTSNQLSFFSRFRLNENNCITGTSEWIIQERASQYW